jgi:hypothetical protein
MSSDVFDLTGQAPVSVQDFVRKNATAFTASKPSPNETPHAQTSDTDQHKNDR